MPGKNIRLLGGKPLIVWTINVAKEISEICDILVTTNAPEIAAVCSEAEALVPWLRPEELATDIASSSDVALHALNWYESEKGAVDGVLLLQPTSPFRTKETIRKGIELFLKHDRQPVIGVSHADAHPMWTLKIEKDQLKPYLHDHGLGTRSQDLPPAYVVNGSFYLIAPTELRRNGTFFGAAAVPLLVQSEKESLDIDTEWDWTVAEAALLGDNLNLGI